MLNNAPRRGAPRPGASRCPPAAHLDLGSWDRALDPALRAEARCPCANVFCALQSALPPGMSVGVPLLEAWEPIPPPHEWPAGQGLATAAGVAIG
jgi:hypothetical protein